jgi:hypothetical protein
MTPKTKAKALWLYHKARYKTDKPVAKNAIRSQKTKKTKTGFARKTENIAHRETPCLPKNQKELPKRPTKRP